MFVSDQVACQSAIFAQMNVSAPNGSMNGDPNCDVKVALFQ